jgi:hypothetical protein
MEVDKIAEIEREGWVRHNVVGPCKESYPAGENVFENVFGEIEDFDSHTGENDEPRDNPSELPENADHDSHNNRDGLDTTP